MHNLRNELERIETLTEIDLQNKSISDMVLSAVEELGEFSTEVKIEEGVFGNQHKQPSEDGSIGEAIDVIIMGFALYFARGGKLETLAEGMKKKLDKWQRNQSEKSSNFIGKLSNQTIQFVSDLMEIKCHHYDLFEEPQYKDELKDAICVIYSDQTGPWRMAINQDGTIVLPVDLMSPRRAAEELLSKTLYAS